MNKIEYAAMQIHDKKKSKSLNAYLKKSPLSKKVTDATKAHKKQVKEYKDALTRNKNNFKLEQIKIKMEPKVKTDLTEYNKRLEEVKARHKAELAALSELKRQQPRETSQIIDELKKTVIQSEHQLKEAKKHQILLTLECLVQNGISIEEIVKAVDGNIEAPECPDADARSMYSGKSVSDFL